MIAALLNNIPTIWAVPLAGYIGAITYQLSQFCPADPPEVPTITALDVVGLLNVFNPVANLPAAEKFQQLIGAYLWYQVCQCDGAATPAPPAPVADPGGWQIDPPVAPPIAAEPCVINEPGGSTPAVTTYPHPLDNTVPLGATACTVDTFWRNASHSASNRIVYQVLLKDANGATHFTSQTWTSFDTAFVESHSFPLFPQTVTVEVVQAGPVPTTQTTDPTAQVKFWCGNGPGSTVEPCCPPDPLLQSQIDRILQLVTLIQRQIVPFAYIQSTAHSGLSGDGHIDVQGLIGCLAQMDTIPPNVGVESGDPLEYWEAGWINWGNTDGSTKREWLTCSPQVSLPAAAGQYTRIGYSLRPGVSITITELVREP